MMKIKPELKVNESGFLFDPTTGESYSLNQMGISYFNWISEGKSTEEMKEMVTTQYNVDEITFEKSFIDFKSRLKNLRLIEDE
jgi:hypothetical protein